MTMIPTTISPRKVEDLRAEAIAILKRIRDLQAQQLDVYTKYLYDLPTHTLASDVSQEIRNHEEQLDLLIAEYRRRKI